MLDIAARRNLVRRANYLQRFFTKNAKSFETYLSRVDNLDWSGPRPVAPQKHSGEGGFNDAAFLAYGVPAHLAPHLTEAGNFALASSSWRTYDTVDRHLEACERDIGRALDFPLSLGDTLTWVAWLIHRRGGRAKTIQIYLSGLRMAHFKRGYFNVNLLSDIVKHILVGLKQRDLKKDKADNRKGRLPVTLEVLRTLRLQIMKSKWVLAKKRLVWAVCVLGFSGSFRVMEMLSRKQGEFDPTTTLLAGDIGLQMFNSNEGTSQVLKVKLKAPKEARLRHGVVVDLYAIGTYLCPVLALKKYVRSLPFSLGDKKPLFRKPDGMAYTAAAFNADLKALLKGTGQEGIITSHSLRAGLATEMGALGYSDSDIMQVGRWHSSAYLHYVKGDRLQRMRVAKDVAKNIMRK